MIDFIVEARGWIYFIVTILLVAFLYSYIYHMYKSQKSGKRDYEKYARLALDDDLSDAPIEMVEKNK